MEQPISFSLNYVLKNLENKVLSNGEAKAILDKRVLTVNHQGKIIVSIQEKGRGILLPSLARSFKRSETPLSARGGAESRDLARQAVANPNIKRRAEDADTDPLNFSASDPLGALQPGR